MEELAKHISGASSIVVNRLASFVYDYIEEEKSRGNELDIFIINNAIESWASQHLDDGVKAV